MKRAFALGMLCFVLPAQAYTIDEPTLDSSSASIRALGSGTSAGYGAGLDALYLNPTALAPGTFSLTAIESSLWAHGAAAATPALLSSFATEGGGSNALSQDDFESLLQDGFGLGAAVALGASGGGFGLGLRAAADSFSYGETAATSSTRIEAEIGFSGGFALPFAVGEYSVTPALDVRPFARIHADAAGQNSASILARYLGVSTPASADYYRSNLAVLNGYGIAVNGGLRIEKDGFFLSGVLRNIGGTPLRYSWHPAGTVLDSLKLGGLPEPAASGDSGYIAPGRYSIPMTLNVGGGYQPPTAGWGSTLLYAELADALSLRYGKVDSAEAAVERTLSHLHAGAQIGIGTKLALRAGFNRGRPGGGVGLRFGFWQLDAAYSAASITSEAPRDQAPTLSLSSRVAF